MDQDKKKKNLQALLEAVQRAKTDGPEPDFAFEHGPSIREPGPGEELGDFRIVREIGRGGMGVIYEAEQLSLRRRVALKVLYPSLSGSVRTLRRFHRESEAVAQVKHDNIIPVWAVGSAKGLSFFAMRFLPGPNLAELIDDLRIAKEEGRKSLVIDLFDSSLTPQPSSDSPLSDEVSVVEDAGLRFSVDNYVFSAIELIANVADGLDAAHRGGVIHRDVKPGNLVFDANGQLVVTDFGIAKSSSNQTMTRTGEFIGSPGYISPEQAMAKRINVDHRTDIYSLGVTLYEFLTLHQPFLHDTLEATLRAILTKEPVSPRKLNPRLPKDIETVVLKAIEKDPDRRFASASEFASELRRILNFEAISSTPPGPLTKASRIISHNRSTMVASIAVGVMVLTAFGFWQSLEWQKQKIVELGEDAKQEFQIREDWVTISMKTSLARIDELLKLGKFTGASAEIYILDEQLGTGLNQNSPTARMKAPEIAGLKNRLISGLEREMLDSGDSPEHRAKNANSRRLLALMLLDPDSLVAKNAAVSLGWIGDPMAVSSLFDAVFFLQETGLQYGLRADFVEALGFIDHQSSYEALLQLVQHDDPSVCHEAVRALGLQTHPSVVGESEKIARSGKDEAGREIARLVLKRRAP